jgi:hypothetical protein
VLDATGTVRYLQNAVIPNEEISMVQKRSEKGLLTPDNCVVALIDLQPQMLFGVNSHDRQTIINNNVLLAKAARVFGVPVVLSTVASSACRSGPDRAFKHELLG